MSDDFFRKWYAEYVEHHNAALATYGWSAPLQSFDEWRAKIDAMRKSGLIEPYPEQPYSK